MLTNSVETKMRNVLAILLLAIIGPGIAFDQSVSAAEDGLERAGCPHQIASYARPGYGSKYLVYYVGGGAKSPWGSCRTCEEGTFGVDYQPIVPGFHSAVALGWLHGQSRQGGTGQYEPNRKVSPLPNVAGRSQRRQSKAN